MRIEAAFSADGVLWNGLQKMPAKPKRYACIFSALKCSARSLTVMRQYLPQRIGEERNFTGTSAGLLFIIENIFN